MKLTALAVVILALGIVVGFALAERSLGGSASAIPQCPGPSSQCPTPTPAPPQQREDQVVILAQGEVLNGPHIKADATEYDSLDLAAILLALDPSEFLPSASFRFEAVWFAASGQISCFRLFDRTASAPMIGTEVCEAALEGGGHEIRVRTAPISLSSGEHEYTIQGRCESLGASPCGIGSVITAARIIVEWTE